MPYFVTQNTDFRLMAITRSHDFSSVSRTERSRSFHSTPALLCSTCSVPNCRTPSVIIRSTSASTATSPVTASACPFVRCTSATVSAAALPSMSATMTRAPSSANSTADSRPIPIPAPVISATFPFNRSPMDFTTPAPDPGAIKTVQMRGVDEPTTAAYAAYAAGRSEETTKQMGRFHRPRLNPLELSQQLPIRHGRVERGLFQTGGVQVMLDDLVPERGTRDLRALQLGDRL